LGADQPGQLRVQALLDALDVTGTGVDGGGIAVQRLRGDLDACDHVRALHLGPGRAGGWVPLGNDSTIRTIRTYCKLYTNLLLRPLSSWFAGSEPGPQLPELRVEAQ